MRAASIGISVCATTSDASIATTIGTATCTRKIDIWFFSPNTSGRKTIVVENVPASVATPTSLTPASVASSGRPGFSCRWRKMLSVITTELSTSMPTASSMPIIVRMLSENPRKYMAPSVTSSDAGTARLTISVVGRWRRKNSSMVKLSTAPTMPALRSSRSDCRMPSAWFSTTRIWMPCSCGILRASFTAAITRSATSTTLPSVVLKTSMPTAGRPSMRRPIGSSGATSSILATSPTRTPGEITMSRTSCRSLNSPIGRTVSRAPFSVISPALTEKLLASSSVRRLRTSTPYAASRFGSTSTRTSRGCTPSSSTRATPSSRCSGRCRYFSSMSYWSVRSWSAEMRMMTIAWSDALKANISSRSAPAGNCARIESSFVRTSKAAALASRSQSNRIWNCAWSDCALARISSTPESVASASSTGRTMSCSISSGVDPG